MVGVLKWRNCSDKEFGEILNKSNNWTHFLKNCGYRNTGNKKPVMRRIKKLNIILPIKPINIILTLLNY